MQDTKKVAGELLVELEKKGVTFETVDGKLKYKDSKGNFTENSKEKVKKYKEEIIEILKKKQTIDEFITDNDYETNVYPLTDVQAAYLVGKTEAVKWGGIGCKGYIEVDFGSYSAEELSRAWKVLVNRHEMLRAKVTEVGFEILERDEIDYEIKIVNLQKMAEREKVDTLSKIREDFSEYVFHTEEPPLFKVLITKRIEGNFFHLLVDLIVSDFASVQLLISEMGELLKGASLEKIRYKFSDYAMFNQQRKGSLKWHQDRMYWLERLKKLPEAPILPQDGRAADKCENTYEFYRFQKHINQSDWKRIKEIAGEYGVTVSSVLIGIYAEVMLDAFASKSESYPTVRLVLLSGDWINTSLPGRLRKIMTNAQMISLGGATEGGIWSIYHEIDEIEERPTILYGKALLGQWMGVVDEELRICPEYVSGQIAIGGYSLAEGYLGDTILTKEKFVYLEEEKNRIYLTGDNGRYVENGDIEFLGRLDNQVKINGHRIEIAEIENAIRGMQNIEDCCVVYNQSIGKGVLIAFIKNKISSISYTKEEYRKQLAFFLPPAMIPSEFVNVESFPLSTNGKIDRKGLAESIQKNIKVKHNAKATLISQKKEYVELAKSIKKIVCSISGNDYIDYEDNLLENGLDSLLLSQISGRIVSDIQEAQGMRFDEILRASLTMPTIMGIAQYISDCKNPSKNQMHSNAGNQTRNSYTVVYIFGDNENEIRDVLIEKLSASNISCKRVGGQEIIERCHEDINVKKKYIIAFSEMASLCITKASELLGENIIINRIFLINPSKAKESDLYLGDISIIDGNSVAIKSWEKAVLGNVREFESNSNDIFDIIMRELENDK